MRPDRRGKVDAVQSRPSRRLTATRSGPLRLVTTLALAALAATAGCALAQQGTAPGVPGAFDVPGLPGAAAPGFPAETPPGVSATPGTVPDISQGGTLPDGTAIDSGAPALGVRPGDAAAPEVLPGVLDSQIKKCWAVPVVSGDPAEGGLARIRVSLLPDGTLARPPAIIDKPAGRLGATFAESAAAAITKCAPYTLPPESYQSWQEMMIVFDTLNF